MVKNEEPSYRLEYPGLTARRYGVVLYNGQELTLTDPVEVMLAQAFLLKPGELSGTIQEFAASFAESEFIKPGAEIALKSIREADCTYYEKKAPLSQFTASEIAYGLEQKLKSAGEHKLWWGSPERAIAKAKNRDNLMFNAHTGGIVLSGDVASKTRGWNYVSINGPFESSLSPLQQIYCSCHDSNYTRQKLGYTKLTHLDFHAALLLKFSEKYPERIKGFDKLMNYRRNLTFFLPYKIPSLAFVAKTLFARYVLGMPKPAISKRLLDHKDIYHPILVQMLANGTADFQVLPNKNFTNVYFGPLRELYVSIIRRLEASGFYERANQVICHSYEKKGTPHEAISLDFERQGTNRQTTRISIVTKGGPPLIVKKTYDNCIVDSFSKPVMDDVSLWQELYVPKRQTDDRSRHLAQYEVRLPIEEGVNIPSPIFEDYGTALRHYFRENPGELKRRLYAAMAKGRISENQQKKVFQMLNKR